MSRPLFARGRSGHNGCMRVVSLVPSLTELIWELAPGTLAGRTKFCTEPPEMAARVPAFGGTKDPDVAAIAALQPDLVIANREENRREDVAALEAAGLDAAWYAERERERDEILPWDHIHAGVDKDFLWTEYERAARGEVTPDCRLQGCSGCGACPERKASPEAGETGG